jgi:hypothetical protein
LQAATGHRKLQGSVSQVWVILMNQTGPYFFFFQVVVYFITETGLFFMLPDVKALCTRRMEALLCYVHQTEGKMGHPCFRPHGMICNNPWGSCRAMGGS